MAAYPGFDYTFTGTYSLGDATGSGTFNVSVPIGPMPLPLTLAFVGLGVLIWRQHKKVPVH